MSSIMAIRRGANRPLQELMVPGQERSSQPGGAVNSSAVHSGADCYSRLETEPVIRFFQDCLGNKSIPQLRSAYSRQLYAGTDRPAGFYGAAFEKLADLFQQSPSSQDPQNLAAKFRLLCTVLERLQNGMRIRSGLSRLWLNNLGQGTAQESLGQDFHQVQQALGQVFRQISANRQATSRHPHWVMRWLSRPPSPESPEQSRLRAWGLLSDALVQELASPTS